MASVHLINSPLELSFNCVVVVSLRRYSDPIGYSAALAVIVGMSFPELSY
jgi:hypothetical protein